MEIIEAIEPLRTAVGHLSCPVGLVPTMGFLHAGHLALIERAREETRSLVVSIFVNPEQFETDEDIKTYPRDIDSDFLKLEQAGVDLVFTPSVSEVYPPGFASYVEIGQIGQKLEGEYRPGHFKGVATIVCKLVSLIRPDRAYFGEKDFQQTRVVSQLNKDLNLGCEIIVLPTVREPDGLALSTRNVYLDSRERDAATILYRALSLAREMVRDGIRDAGEVRFRMREAICAEPLSSLDYISIVDEATLEEIDSINDSARALVAIRIGKTRLIDNIGLSVTD
jgi:pantoate--beta-alanine ligase